MTKTLFVIKTPQGYLRGSKNMTGGSEPSFSEKWEDALMMPGAEVTSRANYHCIRDYATESIEVTYKKG